MACIFALFENWSGFVFRSRPTCRTFRHEHLLEIMVKGLTSFFLLSSLENLETLSLEALQESHVSGIKNRKEFW